MLLVGCATTQSPEPPTAEAPDILIHEAAANGNIEAVKQHIAAGADGIGRTPLHCAAYKGHKEIVELLIAEGADVNAKSRLGQTPLDWADDEIAYLLRKHGAKTSAELNASQN